MPDLEDIVTFEDFVTGEAVAMPEECAASARYMNGLIQLALVWERIVLFQAIWTDTSSVIVHTLRVCWCICFLQNI